MRDRYYIVLIFFFVYFNGKAQYPFEKEKGIKYIEYKNWENIEFSKDSFPLKKEIVIPDFGLNKKQLKIECIAKFSQNDSLDSTILKIYFDDKLVKKININVNPIFEPLSIYMQDVNGDKLQDLKLIFPNYGCGNYNYYCQVVYLFQNKENKFNEIIFTDLYEDFENRIERDFNKDGNFEIITQTFKNYGKHNYWLFNIYNFYKGKLLNVNYLKNYPIMIPLDSYIISKRIPRVKMKEFEIKSPVKQ